MALVISVAAAMLSHGATRAVRRSLWILVGIAIAAACLVLALERRFAALTADALDLPPGTRVWAHRGTHGGFQGQDEPLNRAGENTLAAFDASIAHGFTGVELDIHFLGERGFVVKHDREQPDDLRLEDVFAHCGRKVYYWLDFKNLDNGNVDAVIVAFRQIFAKYPVLDRVLIESGESRALGKLKDAIPGLRAIYWIKRYPPGKGIRTFLRRTRERATVAWFGFRNVSASYYVSKDRFLRDFGRLGLYVYTVNDAALMAALRAAGVRVLLTDLDAMPKGIPP
jgi:glycerophosphoryl diester phosphodiesterase